MFRHADFKSLLRGLPHPPVCDHHSTGRFAEAIMHIFRVTGLSKFAHARVWRMLPNNAVDAVRLLQPFAAEYAQTPVRKHSTKDAMTAFQCWKSVST